MDFIWPLVLCCLQGHSHMHLDSVVKMKSLPFDANQSDIIMFFEAYRLKPNGVQLVVRSDNKPTGEVRNSTHSCSGDSSNHSGHNSQNKQSCRQLLGGRTKPARSS
jgi:hypothetical protein